MEINSRQPVAVGAGSTTSPTHRLGELLGSLVDLIAEFDGTGVLLDVWTGDKSLLVRPVEEMLGQPLISIIGEDAYVPFRTLFERILKSGIAEDFEYSLNLAAGPHLFMARAVPVDAPNGERTIRVLVQDVTGLRKIEEHSRKIESLLKQTQEIANVGSWEYDVERRTFLWSEQMYRMLGLEPGSDAVALDTACQMFHPDDRARVWQDVMTLIETGKPLENELIAQAEQIAHFGSWEMDSQGATRMLSENLYHLIGEDPNQRPITVEEALDRIEPGDAAIVRQNLARAAGEGVPFEQERARCCGPVRGAYMLKSDVNAELVTAIGRVRRGEQYFTGCLASTMAESFAQTKAEGSDDSVIAGTSLTPREAEIIQLLAQGKSNKEAAAVLGVSTRTVESHRNHIMHKMEFESFSDMVRFAIRKNLVEP